MDGTEQTGGGELKNEPAALDISKLSADVGQMLEEVKALKDQGSKTEQNTKDLQSGMKEQHTLLVVGYLVLLIMTATLIVVVVTLFVEVLKDHTSSTAPREVSSCEHFR